MTLLHQLPAALVNLLTYVEWLVGIPYKEWQALPLLPSQNQLYEGISMFFGNMSTYVIFTYDCSILCFEGNRKPKACPLVYLSYCITNFRQENLQTQ